MKTRQEQREPRHCQACGRRMPNRSHHTWCAACRKPVGVYLAQQAAWRATWGPGRKAKSAA